MEEVPALECPALWGEEGHFFVWLWAVFKKLEGDRTVYWLPWVAGTVHAARVALLAPLRVSRSPVNALHPTRHVSAGFKIKSRK